jgi:DNA-binding MarR family transcriptional regulator
MARQASSPIEARTREKAMQMARTCASSNLRRLERQVTSHYDEYLRPTGITAVQLPILAAIGAGLANSISALAVTLDRERSTLSRDLRVLEKKKLVESFDGDDRRTRVLRLTARGLRTLDKAHAAWQRAQLRLLSASENLEDLLRKLRKFERSLNRMRQSRTSAEGRGVRRG